MPDVSFVDDLSAADSDLAFDRDESLHELAGSKSRQAQEVERQLRAVVQLLAAFGVLDTLDERAQRELIGGIGEVLGIEQ